MTIKRQNIDYYPWNSSAGFHSKIVVNGKMSSDFTSLMIMREYLMFRFSNLNYEKKLTVLFICVGVAFTLLTIPDVILQTMDTLHSETDSWRATFNTLQPILQTVFCCNFTINPFIYYTMNSYFRTRVMNLINFRCSNWNNSD